MSQNKIESYGSRSRIAIKKQDEEVKSLKLKKIELDLYKESIIAEHTKKNKNPILKKILNVFKKK